MRRLYMNQIGWKSESDLGSDQCRKRRNVAVRTSDFLVETMTLGEKPPASSAHWLFRQCLRSRLLPTFEEFQNRAAIELEDSLEQVDRTYPCKINAPRKGSSRATARVRILMISFSAVAGMAASGIKDSYPPVRSGF